MFKKSKLIAGVALLVQSLTFLILFFVFFSRKKKTANAYLGVSLATALSGAALLAWYKEEEKEENELLWGNDWEDCDDLFEDTYNDEIDCVIEENADEEIPAEEI
ncbi:MAG: hypothetical protein E7582_02925 [Ruminococcaceae bacterium]|nr:hypothetical protein [Oscillospiraceae bacterium]